MTYAELEPAAALEPYVASYWSFAVAPEAGQVEHWVPPDGCVSLAFRRGSPMAVVVGPWTVPLTPDIVAGDAFFGVRFWPGTSPALLPIPPAKLKDRVVPALEFASLSWCADLCGQLWPKPDGVLDPSAANRALAALLPGARPLDGQVVSAARRVMATGGDVRIAVLVEESGLSPRQFRRRFTAAVGVSPKELARIWRFRRCALAALDPASPAAARWADLAAAHGFADQAHLVREFRHLLGLPPTLFSRQFARIKHRNLRPT